MKICWNIRHSEILSDLFDKLNSEKCLTQKEWVDLISTFTAEDREYAAAIAR